MAYPEVIPPLKPREGREFLKRLRSFQLTEEQRAFWANPRATKVEASRKK